MSAELSLRAFDPRVERTENVPAAPASPATLTGGDLIDQFLTELKVRRNAGMVGAAHYDNYRRALEAAPPYQNGKARYVGLRDIIGALPIRDLKQHDITRWLAANPQWKSAETRSNNVRAAIALANWADEEGLLKPAPYKKSKRLREERVTRRDASDAELATIWEHAPQSLLEVLWLIGRGFRECEAIRLKWTEVSFLESAATLSVHKTVRKTRSPKIVGFDPEDRDELLDRFAARRPGQTLVCVTDSGRAWTKNNVCKAFRAVREKCGLAPDLVLNSFRHRFVTQARLRGADPEAVARAAGHSRQMSERQYMHFGNKPEHIAREKMRSAREAIEIKVAAGSATPPASAPQQLLLF